MKFMKKKKSTWTRNCHRCIKEGRGVVYYTTFARYSKICPECRRKSRENAIKQMSIIRNLG